MAGLPTPLILRIIRESSVISAEDRFEAMWDERELEKIKFEDALHTIEILASAFTDMDDKLNMGSVGEESERMFVAKGNGILFMRNGNNVMEEESEMTVCGGDFDDLFGTIDDGRFPKSMWGEIMGPYPHHQNILRDWCGADDERFWRWGVWSFRSHRCQCREGDIWTSSRHLDDQQNLILN